jgi:hypothetical protein
MYIFMCVHNPCMCTQVYFWPVSDPPHQHDGHAAYSLGERLAQLWLGSQPRPQGSWVPVTQA